MRFVDASVFVHAYMVPRRVLRPHEVEIKGRAKAIVRRIDDGEFVVTSVVHLSEIFNLMETHLPLNEALALETGLLARENIEVLQVSKGDYVAATMKARANTIGLNDLLAWALMEGAGISEVYSFDKDFDRMKGLIRVSR
jgi:predicted nucleic acid-binding protein